jgi:hypothetical protein
VVPCDGHSLASGNVAHRAGHREQHQAVTRTLRKSGAGRWPGKLKIGALAFIVVMDG